MVKDNKLSLVFNNSSQPDIDNNNIAWQALSDTPSLIVPNTHYASSNQERIRKQKKEEEFDYLLFFLQAIQTLEENIEAKIKLIRDHLDKFYVLGGDILDQISKLRDKIDNIEISHVAALKDLELNSLNGKDISEVNDKTITEIYDRYESRGLSTNRALSQIISDQIEYEQSVYIPLLLKQRSKLGNIYNQTIAYAEKLNNQLSDAELEYKELADMEVSDLKLMELEKLDKTLEEIDQQASEVYQEFEKERTTLETQIEKGVSNDENTTPKEKQETSISPNLSSFGLKL